MSKKYELLKNDKIVYGDATLYRIKALVDIPNIVKAGELGGYIESEKNLSHEGNCWVADDAYVYNSAYIYMEMQKYMVMHKYLEMQKYMVMHMYLEMHEYLEM